MGFRVGFHKTLFKLGGIRFGVGFSKRGSTGLIMMFCLGIFYLMWYMVLGLLWITYGFVWLIFVLPIKEIKKLRARKIDTMTE